MDAFALDMDNGMRMDVPLRVFSRTYYPNLTTLYDRVGVKFTNADYSFSCSLGTMRSEQTVYFRYANYYDMRFALPSLSGVYRSFSRCYKYCKLLFEIAYFFYFGAKHLKGGKMKELTFGQYLEREGYSEEFINELVVPMLAIVCTCSYGAVKNYPAGRLPHCSPIRLHAAHTVFVDVPSTPPPLARLLFPLICRHHCSLPLLPPDVQLLLHRQSHPLPCGGRDQNSRECVEQGTWFPPQAVC
jgi:predicted NAD/FAD-binding protein